MNRPRCLCFLFCFVIALSASSPACAQFLPGGGIDTPDPVLPPNGVYLTPDQVHAMYTGANLQIVLSAIQHRPFKDRLPEHFGTNNENHNFASHLTGNGSCVGDCGPIPPNFPAQFDGRVETVALNKPPGADTGTFQTEMLSMNLTGFGGAMIRESPTLPSLGQTKITDIGGGMYHIDSFFDVFTELSLDGGQQWMPSAGSAHVNLVVPEPASLVLLALGVLGFGGARRRR